MIKLIKLCFVGCLIFRATFVEAVIDQEEAYEALKIFDAEFWQNKIVPYYQEQLKRDRNSLDFLFGSITQDVFNYLDPFYVSNGLPKLFNEPTPVDVSKKSTLDFSETTMIDVISMFYEILQCKVYFRDDRDGGYKTNFKCIPLVKEETDEKALDPYFSQISIGNKSYHFCLDYNGNEKSRQPGNCCLRQCNEEAQQWCIDYKYNAVLNDNDHYILQNLLLCLEVSRRKIEDPNRENSGLKDEFCDLPILGAILVGLELMNDQIIVRNEFFVTIEEYCCFSGTDREEHIKNLLQTYCYYKNFQTADQFLEEIQKLYKQFIELKITDRVLWLQDGGEFYPSENSENTRN